MAEESEDARGRLVGRLALSAIDLSSFLDSASLESEESDEELFASSSLSESDDSELELELELELSLSGSGTLTADSSLSLDSLSASSSDSDDDDDEELSLSGFEGAGCTLTLLLGRCSFSDSLLSLLEADELEDADGELDAFLFNVFFLGSGCSTSFSDSLPDSDEDELDELLELDPELDSASEPSSAISTSSPAASASESSDELSSSLELFPDCPVCCSRYSLIIASSCGKPDVYFAPYVSADSSFFERFCFSVV